MSEAAEEHGDTPETYGEPSTQYTYEPTSYIQSEWDNRYSKVFGQPELELHYFSKDEVEQLLSDPGKVGYVNEQLNALIRSINALNKEPLGHLSRITQPVSLLGEVAALPLTAPVKYTGYSLRKSEKAEIQNALDNQEGNSTDFLTKYRPTKKISKSIRKEVHSGKMNLHELLQKYAQLNHPASWELKPKLSRVKSWKNVRLWEGGKNTRRK